MSSSTGEDLTIPRRIRVARIITRLNVGGPAINAMILTERLDPTRFETSLISGSLGPGEGDMLRLRPGLSRPPTYIPALRRELSPLRDLRAFVGIVAALRRCRPDIVHTHLSKAGMLGRVAAKACGVRAVVHTFHGTVFDGYFGPARTRVFLAIERVLARMSTRVIAISGRQREELLRLGIARPEKIVEIPLGLDLAPYAFAERGALRRELCLGSEVPLVGIVARLVPIKRVDVFLAAAARLAERGQDAHFVIAGDGEEGARLRRQAKDLGIEDRTHFLGWRADLRAIYGDLDVVVLTSDSEGTPVSIIEALAAGRPVVATAVGGVPDVLGRSERGLLVPVGDDGAIADALGTLLSEPAMARALASAGREHVYAVHDADSLVRRISALYTELVS